MDSNGEALETRMRRRLEEHRRHIGGLLREIRLSAGLTVEGMGFRLGWSNHKVERWEGGLARQSHADAVHLARTLGVAVEAVYPALAWTAA